jgi:hypothetical protein
VSHLRLIGRPLVVELTEDQAVWLYGLVVADDSADPARTEILELLLAAAEKRGGVQKGGYRG